MGVVHRFPGEKGNIKNNNMLFIQKNVIEMEFELSKALLLMPN